MQVHYFIMSFLSVLTVTSINVNGLRDNLKREIIFDYIVRSTINIVCMQETHIVNAKMNVFGAGNGRRKYILVIVVGIPKELLF